MKDNNKRTEGEGLNKKQPGLQLRSKHVGIWTQIYLIPKLWVVLLYQKEWWEAIYILRCICHFLPTHGRFGESDELRGIMNALWAFPIPCPVHLFYQAVSELYTFIIVYNLVIKRKKEYWFLIYHVKHTSVTVVSDEDEAMNPIPPGPSR